MAKGDTEFVGYGYRIVLGKEDGQEESQARTLENYRATNGNRKRPEPSVGSLVNGGWGLLLKQSLQGAGAPDAMNDVLTELAYNLGPDGEGGTLWLVPVSRSFQGGTRNIPVYREVHVYQDAANRALIDAQNAARDNQTLAQAKEQELAALQAQQNAGDIDLKIAIEKGRQGKGAKPVEITVSADGTSVFVASSPSESSAPDGPHPGKSILDGGEWERVSNNRKPSDFGLPVPILSYWPDGSVRVGKLEYESLMKVAKSTMNQGGLFGGLFPSGSEYPPAQVKMARDALDYLGIPPSP